MTEITAQPPESTQGSSGGGLLAMAAKPPGDGFAEKLSQAQETASANPKVPTNVDGSTGKAANPQSNTESQSPDPKASQETQIPTPQPVAAPVGQTAAQAILAAASITATSNSGKPVPAPGSQALPEAAIQQTQTQFQQAVTPKAPKSSKVKDSAQTPAPAPTPSAAPNPLVSAAIIASTPVPQPTLTTPQPQPVQASPAEDSQSTPVATAAIQISNVMATPATPQAELGELSGQQEVQEPSSIKTAIVEPSAPQATTPTQTLTLTQTLTQTAPPTSQVSLDTLKQSFGDIVEARSFRSASTDSSHTATPQLSPQTTPPPANVDPVQAQKQTPASTPTPPTSSAAAAQTAIQPMAMPDPKDSADRLSPTQGSHAAQPGAAPVTNAASQPVTSGQPSDPDADDDFADNSGDQGVAGVKPKQAATGDDFIQAAPQPQAQTPSTVATQQTQDPVNNSTDRAQLINQVADRIQLLAVTRQQDGVVVHLQPPNLGAITLIVKTVASNVTAQVTATDDHVRSALELGRDQLGQQLQARGFHLSSISVGSTSSSADTGSDLSQNPRNSANSAGLWQGQQQSAQQNAGRAAAQRTSVKPETSVSSRPSSRTSSQQGLDLWI